MNEFFKKEKIRMTTFNGIVECILKEGLITSYDVHKLKNTLEKKFGNDISVLLPNQSDLTDHNFDYHAYTFTVLNKEKNLKEMKKILNLFGYYINKFIPKKNYIKYQIEPTHPIQINDILNQQNITYFYHMSPTINLKRIQKIGLAPRGTKSDFYHPDDRIYLINGKGNNLKGFFNSLAKNKHMRLDEFTVFKIPFNDKYKYYLDDMATFIESYKLIAVFILQNIPPNELEIVKI